MRAQSSSNSLYPLVVYQMLCMVTYTALPSSTLYQLFPLRFFLRWRSSHWCAPRAKEDKYSACVSLKTETVLVAWVNQSIHLL